MKNSGILVLLLLACVVVVGGPAYADTFYWPNDDTFTYQAGTGTNFDGQGLLVKSQTGSRRYSWLEFTLGNDSVSEAKLYVCFYSIPSGWGTSHTLQFAANEYSFDETLLKWNNQPDTTLWTIIPGWTAKTADLGKYLSADITSFYNSNLGKTVTFKMYQTDSGSVGGAYEDREGYRGTTNYPYISAKVVPEPSSLLALACGCIGLTGLVRRHRS